MMRAKKGVPVMTEKQKNTLTLAKGGEKYIFTYDALERRALLGIFGRLAANPDLNFSWHDAAVLSKKIREKDEGVASRTDLMAAPFDSGV
jgi:hypothetical protein